MNLINIIKRILINYPDTIPNSNYKLMYIEDVDITTNIINFEREANKLLFAIKIDPNNDTKLLGVDLYNILLSLYSDTPENYVLALVDNNFIKYNIQSNKYFINNGKNGIKQLIYGTNYDALINNSEEGSCTGGGSSCTGGGSSCTGGGSSCTGGGGLEGEHDEDNNKVTSKYTMFYSNESGCFKIC
jgi:hypothetical protein